MHMERHETHEHQPPKTNPTLTALPTYATLFSLVEAHADTMHMGPTPLWTDA